MDVSSGDTILLGSNFDIGTFDLLTTPVFVRIVPIVKGKSSTTCSILCTGALDASMSYENLVTFVESEYNALQKSDVEVTELYKIESDPAFKKCIFSVSEGLAFDENTSTHIYGENNIITVSEESMAHAVSIKSTKWSQICNDESLKNALSQSASQIYKPITKAPTKRDNSKARALYRLRLDNELQNPIIGKLRFILLDIKVHFCKETKKRSIADTRLSKVPNYPSKLHVNVGNYVSYEEGVLNSCSTQVFLSFSIDLPTIIEDSDQLATETPFAFTLDMFRTSVLREIVSSSTCKGIVNYIGTKSPIFVKKCTTRRQVSESDMVTTTSQLLGVICNDCPRNAKDNSEAVVSISFGAKGFDDTCINQNSNRFVISLMKQHHISGNLLDDYVSTGRQDCETEQLFYSQGDSRLKSMNITINKSADKSASNKESAVQSRTDPLRANALLQQIYGNSHHLNPYYHAFTDKIQQEWSRYLCYDTIGKICLRGIDSNASFESGFIQLPLNFLPYYYTLNEDCDWTSQANWTRKIPCEPYKPKREQYPPKLGEEIPPHPSKKETKGNSVLEDVLVAYVAEKKKEKQETNSKSEVSSTRGVSNVMFTRSEQGIRNAIMVPIKPSESVISHVKRAGDINKGLVKKFEWGVEFSLVTSCEHNTIPVSITKKLCDTMTLQDILNNDNIVKPIYFDIVGTKIYEENEVADDMF